MKQIIDIPDELFSIFKKHGIMAFDYVNEYDKDQIAIAITHGTPYNQQGDLISREALKKYAREVMSEQNATNFSLLKMFDEIIDNAPTVEITEEQAIDKLHKTGWLIEHDKEMTTRPQGEWIKEDNGKTTDLYRCSICGRSIMLCKNADLSKYPFCHCGAEMKGGAE